MGSFNPKRLSFYLKFVNSIDVFAGFLVVIGSHFSCFSSVSCFVFFKIRVLRAAAWL